MGASRALRIRGREVLPIVQGGVGIGVSAHLGAALHGDVERGLFFRGSEPLPLGSAIRPAKELVARLLEESPLQSLA